MDGDWEEIKGPAKKPKPQRQQNQAASGARGGKTSKGILVPGAIRQSNASAAAAQQEVNNHASAVADYDFGVDEGNEEIKFESVSHTCAMSVKNARMAAEMTQAQLAKKCNEKTSTIVDVENGTARYSADLINRIERALNAKIDRGRKKKKGGR